MKSEKKHNAKKFTLLFLSIFGHRKTVSGSGFRKRRPQHCLYKSFLDGQRKKIPGLNSKNISHIKIKDVWFSIMARNGERQYMNWNKNY
jgi:hypothetical protein